MGDLNEEWTHRVNEAMRRAAAEGRGDVADYLRLRQVNDEAREVGIKWLFDLFTALVGVAVRGGASINAERSTDHKFSYAGATMVGSRIIFRNGVRALTLEAGYPRTPADGFIVGGGLAQANVHHFGDRRAGIELTLVRTAANELHWYEVVERKRERRFTEREGYEHVRKFLTSI